MARSSYQKLKPIYIMDYLLKNSDEQHPVTITQLIEYLAAQGIQSERKSIYGDLEALQFYGLDIVQSSLGRSAGYYIANRSFELPELKLLVDSVQSSKFITHKKTATLIRKIETLASIHEAQLLDRQVFVTNRIKTMNESIYYNVDAIHHGISTNCKIQFRYFEYPITKERRYRKDGAFYVVSPFAMTGDDENYYMVGFDLEVAQKVAEKLGVKATFVEGEWDGLLAGVDGGRYDSMANGVEITEERAQKYDFSDPYCYIRTAIIVKSDDDSINSFEDLNGKTTANTISSTYATLAESYGAKTTGVDDLNQTIELLLNGRVDATLNAEVTYFDYLKEHPDANIKIAALTNDASQVAFPVRKGDETATLREALNQAINELREDGTIAEISEKYFGTDLSQAPSAN